jgi:hypothetical protein
MQMLIFDMLFTQHLFLLSCDCTVGFVLGQYDILDRGSSAIRNGWPKRWWLGCAGLRIVQPFSHNITNTVHIYRISQELNVV